MPPLFTDKVFDKKEKCKNIFLIVATGDCPMNEKMDWVRQIQRYVDGVPTLVADKGRRITKMDTLMF